MKVQVVLAPEAQSQLAQLTDQVEKEGEQVRRHVTANTFLLANALKAVAVALVVVAVVIYVTNQEAQDG